MLHLKKAQAAAFYAVHVGKPFFDSLAAFMTSGPVVVLALEKANAIADWRKLMGATNPANAGRRNDPQEARREHRDTMRYTVRTRKIPRASN